MNRTAPRAMTRGDHHHSPAESRPVFADPSGRRRRVLRFAGIGSMAVLAAFLVAVVMAMTGGPQAPLTQWAVPQAPPGARHGGDQALTGGNSRSGAPAASSGTGSTAPVQSASIPPSGAPSARPTTSSAASPASTATASPAASPAATKRGHGHANPHSSPSTRPTA